MKKRLLYFFLFISFTSFTTSLAQTPRITSFTPLSAKPGDLVTITGSNFNSTAANNVVIFGATKAVVNTASSTSLTVTVPVSAIYAPITVLNSFSNLAASSAANFNPVYSPVKINMSPTDFETKESFGTGDEPYKLAVSDLDGDGKPDLVSVNLISNSISILRNTSSSGSLGPGSFAPKVDIQTINFPSAIKIDDLDGDGKPDLVVTNRNDNSISIYHNTSVTGSITSSSFATGVRFSAGDSPMSLAIRDLDGDGKPDLAVTNLNEHTISIFRNTSITGSINTNSFADKVDLITGIFPQDIAISDIDGDGKPDLVSANQASNGISVFLNISSSGSLTINSFAPKVDVTTGINIFALTIGDLDSDGKPDVIAIHPDINSASILRNTSSIGLPSFATIFNVTTGINPQSVVISDLDGDGKPDFAVSNNNSRDINYYRNIGSGNLSASSFAPSINFLVGNASKNAVIVDLDGDGRPDFAIPSMSRDIAIMRNVLPTTITSFSPINAKPGDEVIITGTNFSPLPANNIVFFGATSAVISAATSSTLTVTVPKGATYAPISVLNKRTTLTAYSNTNFNPIYSPPKTNLTPGDFLPKQDLSTGVMPNSIATGDLDGDGKPDYAVANQTDHTVSVYLNTSLSNFIRFANKVDFPTGQFPRSIKIADIDGDGKLDLLVVNQSSNSLSVLRNIGSNGVLNFAAKIDFTTGNNPMSMAIGDLDHDGKPDVAVVNLGSNTVSVLRNIRNNGVINFAPKVDFPTGQNPLSLGVGDINNDGLVDLAVANYLDQTVSVLQNTSVRGNLNFLPKVDFTTGIGPSNVSIGDLDGDGMVDLAIANNVSNTVTILRNTSTIASANFALKVDLAAGISASSVVIGDLDGDTKPDLAVGHSAFDATSMSIIRNVSTVGVLTFEAKDDILTGTKPSSIAIADFDIDGKPDLVTSNVNSNTVSIMRNIDLPILQSSGTLTALSTVYGTPSSSINFVVSGTNLLGPITITPPIDFQVSINNINFTSTLRVGTNGNIGSTTVYLRLRSTSQVGTYSGNIIISSPNAVDVLVPTVNNSITPKALVVKAKDYNRLYDGQILTAGNGVTFTGFVNNETVSFLQGTLAYEGTIIGAKDVGTYSIIPKGYTSVKNYTISFEAGVLNLTAAPLTVVANTQSKVYGATDPTLNYTVTGLIAPDVLTGTLVRVVGENIGTYAIDQGSLLSSSNYNLTYTSANLTITPKSLNITANAQNKIYGVADPILTYTSNGLEGTDALTGSLARAIGEQVGPYAINIGTLQASANYSISFTTANLIISAKPIVISANQQTKAFGDVDPILTYNVAGLVGTDVLTGSLTRAAGEQVGTYLISQGTLQAGNNYTTSYNPANFEITLKPLIVTVDPQTKVYGDIDPILTYTVTGLVGNDALLGTLARNVGEQVGTYVINQGTLRSMANYNIIFNQANFIIIPKEVIVTANAQQKVYGAIDPILTYSITGLSGTDAITGSLTRLNGEQVGSYAINKGSLTVNSNYRITFNPANLVINAKPLTIIANSQSKIYGDTDPILTYTSTGLIGLDAITGLLARATGEQAGIYSINQGSLNAGINYAISFTGADLTISKAILTITADNKSICLTKDFPAFTVSYAGFKNNDTQNNLTAKPQVNTNATNNSPIGTYVITASAAISNNYTLSYVNGTLTISELPIVNIVSSKGNSVSKGETLTLTATGGTTYFWANANGIITGQNTATLRIRPNINTIYTVTASNANGCSQTSSINIEVRDDIQAVKPNNILTPNGDGVNDLWEVANIDVFPNNKVQVYDRNGRVLFTKQGYNNNWDGSVNGKQLAEGTYYYLIDFGPGQPKQKGYITLIRQ